MPEQQCIGLLHQSTSATVAFVRRKFLSRALQVVRLILGLRVPSDDDPGMALWADLTGDARRVGCSRSMAPRVTRWLVLR
jgi:hypothetical protein